MRKKLISLTYISIAFFLLLPFSKSTAQGDKQTYTIHGRITDDSGEAVPFVTIWIKSKNIGTESDKNGFYTLKNVPYGQYILEANALGYATAKKNIITSDNTLDSIDFVLKETTEDLSEVLVKSKGDLSALRASAQAVTVIKTEKVRFQASDLGEVMARTEGISVQRAGGLGSNIRFSLNGLSGDKVRFFYDGIPLEFSAYSFGIANIPVNGVDHMKVYKGVVPIDFGADALGGAINIAPPKTKERFSGSASYQTGSFGTHRATLNTFYNGKDSGFFVNAGGFYDYTKNNYKIDVAIPNEQGRLQPFKLERFHDAYLAGGGNLTLGLRNKSWADEVKLDAYYGSYDNEVQNSQSPGLVSDPLQGIDNAVASSPFGEVRFKDQSSGVNLQYRYGFASKWKLDFKGGYNYNKRVSIDTSYAQFDWFGNRIRENNFPGEFGDADHLITKSQSLFARQQIQFDISKNQSLRLSIAPTYTHRTADDLLIDGTFDPALDDLYLLNFVTGIEHTTELFDKNLQNIFFAKNYIQTFKVKAVDPSIEGIKTDKRSENNLGVGNGLRYNWSDQFLTKLSYEYAIRLPRQNEIFGDGQLIIENLDLRPESSHNANLQLSYTNKPTAKVNWQVQGNLFLRKIENLIFLLVNADDFGAYQNVWSATSQGFEFSGRVDNLINRLSISANTTYQTYKNTSDTGPFATYKGDKIPNTPYFFANASVNYSIPMVFNTLDNLSVFYNTRFVESFYLGWESAGLRQFKKEVPSQTTHTAGITYKINLGKTESALTTEIQNITDAKIFDFYGVQRPGRSIYVKLTSKF